MNTDKTPEPLSYTLPRFAKASGISLRGLYREVAAGRLRTITRAGRRLVTKAESERYLSEEGDP
jgi:hypothetical protein